MIRQILLTAAAVVLLSSIWPAPAQAQDAGSDNHLLVWNAVSSGARAVRAPGRMVDAGIGRYAEVRANPLARPNITEQDDGPSLTKQIKIPFIEEFFANLNAILLGFNNMIRAEGGLPPYVPTPITPSTGTSLL